MLLNQLFCLIFASVTNSYKILGVFPSPWYSQFILGETLMGELAKNGHEVVVISPYKSKIIDNFHTISTERLLEQYKDANFFELESRNFASSIMGSQKSGLAITEYTLAAAQELIYSNATFDLVIVEQFFCEALFGLGRHFNTSLVIFSSIGPTEWNNNQLGNPHLPSYMPITKLPYTTKMSFLQRVKNTVAFLFDAVYKKYVTYPAHDKLLKKYFPKPMDLADVMSSASLMLLNSHYSITEPFPLIPGMIEIGGFHIQPKQLPNNLQKILDEAKDGAIYFSMGTSLKASNLNKTLLQEMINVFSKLKQKVLWKFDTTLNNLPENVFISDWFPQREILAHPNVRLFISHGGLLSTTESVFFGVPLIGIPVFGDQKMNVAKAEQYGFAYYLPYRKLSGNNLQKAIHSVLKDPKYRKNVKHRSRLYHDQPIKPLDLATYWIEFTIRHKGEKPLKFSGEDMKWFQMYLLDVFGFCALCTFVLGIFVKFIIKTIFCKQNKNVLQKIKLK